MLQTITNLELNGPDMVLLVSKYPKEFQLSVKWLLNEQSTYDFFCESCQIQSSLGTTTHDVWSLNDLDLFDAVGRFYFQLLLTLPRQLLAGNFWSLKTIRWHQAIWILRHGSAIVLDNSFGKCTATLFPKQRIGQPVIPQLEVTGSWIKMRHKEFIIC